MDNQNALWNCKNPNQGAFTKALCICSAGLLRSPTIALLMGERGYNTRAVGIYDYALIRINSILAEWADMFVFASEEHAKICAPLTEGKPVFVLNIPDQYEYRDPELQSIIVKELNENGLVRG